MRNDERLFTLPGPQSGRTRVTRVHVSLGAASTAPVPRKAPLSVLSETEKRPTGQLGSGGGWAGGVGWGGDPTFEDAPVLQYIP